jgi:hypothetical protein
MIFVLLRFIITIIGVYVVLTLARDFRVAFGLVRRGSVKKESPEQRMPEEPVIKPKEEYRDVQEAKFREIHDN